MTEPAPTPPPEKTTGDHVHGMTRAVISSIPVVGNVAAEIFSMAVAAPIEKRRDEWQRDVGERLLRLERTGRVDIASLADSEEFISAAVQMSQAALKSHQKEKRELLRNALLNSALSESSDDFTRQSFLDAIESLTVSHIQFLKLFADPPRWFDERNIPRPEFAITSSLSQLLGHAFPALNVPDVKEKILKDLTNLRFFAGGSLNTMMTPDGAWTKRTTDLGNQFLRFVSDPTDSDTRTAAST